MNITPPAPVPGRTTLYHRRHAWQQRAKALSHLGPALVLLLGFLAVFDGREALTPLVGLEFLVGAAYLVLMVRELLHLRHHPFHREPVAWLELAAAGILALESYHIWHRHHAAQQAGAPHRLHVLPWLYAGLALVYVWLAFRLKSMDGRRFLHLHPGGFGVRTQRLGRAHELSWDDVSGLEPAGPADLLVRRADGSVHRISFAEVHDGAARRDELLAHYRTATTEAAPGPPLA